MTYLNSYSINLYFYSMMQHTLMIMMQNFGFYGMIPHTFMIIAQGLCLYGMTQHTLVIMVKRFVHNCYVWQCYVQLSLRVV